LAQLLRCPEDDLDYALGDAITDTSARVMAGVFDGDPQPLYDVILDPQANQFVRSEMCQALAMVALQGGLPRPEAARFLETCFTELKPERDCFVWDGWQTAVAALGLAELRPQVKQAFERESIDPSWLSYHHFEEDLNATLECPQAPSWFLERHAPFGDLFDEFSDWGFQSERELQKERYAVHDELSLWGVGEGQAFNRYRNVGRNDPCPCGSGKKFKKCCLDAHRDAPFQGEAA
jgi:hypothetical protein